MRGYGRGSAAISIVNALLCGQGCSAAIDLGCEATVEVERTLPGELPSVRLEPATDTPLARAAVRAAVRSVAPTQHIDIRASVRSGIPAARGLKSSSAVSCALIEGVHHAYGVRPEPIEVARSSAEVSRAIRLSATGAFDDACASVLGGFVRTDNTHDELLDLRAAPEAWEVALVIPRSAHPPSSSLLPRLSGLSEAGEAAIRLAESGDYLSALERSSTAVEGALGYRYEALRRALHARGALAVGVTGMGPAIAVVAPQGAAAQVVHGLRFGDAEVRFSRFRPPAGGPGEEEEAG